jgi:hypothetical protein
MAVFGIDILHAFQPGAIAGLLAKRGKPDEILGLDRNPGFIQSTCRAKTDSG